MRRPLAALALFLAGCSSGERASLLLVTLDTVRADRLGSYGSPAGLTPHLDALARESVRFEQVACQAPLTTPSHATIFTGLLPQRHGIRNNESFALKDSVTTLAELLGRSGFRTGAFIGAFPLDSRYGLARGFEVYDQAFLGRPGAVERSADEVLDATLGFIRESVAAKRRYFAFAHVFDAHSPYEPPPPWRERFPPYEGEIAYVDDALGRFFSALRQEGLLEGLVVSILADHGEALGEHGENTHGVLLYEPTVRVPWLVRLPQARRGGAVVREPVRTVDVAPTLLGLLDVPSLKEVDGVDLSASVQEGAPAPDLASYSESLYLHLLLGWAELRSLKRGALKLIDAPRPELFDLTRDPGESTNLYEQERRTAAKLKQELEALRELEPPQTPSADAELAERLGSLGYAAGATRSPGGTARDPKDGMEIWREIEAGTSSAASDRARARAHFERARKLDPKNGLVLKSLGDIELTEGRPQRALAFYQESLSAGFLHPDLEIALARAEAALGRGEKALAVLSPLGESPEALLETSRLELSLGRPEKARERAEALLASRPEHVPALVLLGRSLRALGQPGEAEAPLRQALNLAPSHGEAANELGAVLAEQGRNEEAAAAFRKAIALSPESAEPRRNLAQVVKGAEAEQLLREALRLRPEFAEAHVDLAKLLAEARRLPEAEASIKTALRLRPDDYQAVFVAARLAELGGRRSEARSGYARFLKLAPPGLAASREMARLRLEALQER
jgi:choline-sulfatase